MDLQCVVMTFGSQLLNHKGLGADGFQSVSFQAWVDRCLGAWCGVGGVCSVVRVCCNVEGCVVALKSVL